MNTACGRTHRPPRPIFSSRTPTCGVVNSRSPPLYVSTINQYLLKNNLRIQTNPCVSPDFCLDWTSLAAKLTRGDQVKVWPKSGFSTAAGSWMLVEDTTGDCAWKLSPVSKTSPTNAPL